MISYYIIINYQVVKRNRMLNLNLELQPETEKRLKQIFEQYEDQEIFAQNYSIFY